MKKKMIILGVGHNTPVYIELAELLGYEIEGLYHYSNTRTGETFCGQKILGENAELLKKSDLAEWSFSLSMGNNAIRLKLGKEIREKRGHIPTMIHPTASVSKYANLAQGVVVHSQATVQAGVIVGHDSVISFNAGITHNAEIGEGVYVSGSSIVGAHTSVGRCAFVGMGSTVISSKVKVIGENAIVGAGSVVTKDVEPHTTVAGNPAKIIP